MAATGPRWRVSQRREAPIGASRQQRAGPGLETRHHDRLIEERLSEETGHLHFGVDDLTATEERVAGLVAEGLTNREVAQSLYMSPYTVDSHLRAIYRKWSINSRVKLAYLVASAAN